MADTHTETTRQGFGGKVGNSFKGILFGIVLFLAAFPVLFLNEGAEVKRIKGLDEGAKIAVTAPADSITAANEGKLVHITGSAATTETLMDDDFGLSVTGTQLIRSVEMYQWKEESKSETKEKMGGSSETVTTYSYIKDWNSSLVKSSSFKKPDEHQNPGAIPFKDKKILAKNVTLGAFKLNSSQIARVGTPVELSDTELSSAASVKSGKRTVSGGYIYIGKDPSQPEIGDVRVSYKLAQPGPISLLAMQSGSTFTPYTNEHTTIDELKNGTFGKDEMFKSAVSARKTMTWIIRLVGFLMMVIGLNTILRPISTILGVIPLLGKIASGLTGIVAFFLGFGFAFITIAVAWVFYRPHIAIILLLLGAAAVIIPIVISKARAKKA